MTACARSWSRSADRRIGLAKVQELRDAVLEFRQSGKLAVAWSESFGDFVRGNVPYYLATGFDRIYLQPSGTLGLTGVAVEQVFLHGALERLGIDFQSRQAARVQVGRRPADRDRVHRPGPGGGRPAGRVRDRAARGGDRGRPRADRRAGPGAARAGAVPRPAGAVRGAGGRAALPRPGLRAGPQGGRRRRDAALPAALPPHALARRPAAAAPQRRPGADAGAARAVRRDDLRARRDQVRAQRPGRPGRRRDGLRHGGGRAAGGGGRRGRARRRAPGEQPRRLLHRVRRDLARGGPGPRGGQARRRVDGRRGRVGRVLHIRARPT